MVDRNPNLNDVHQFGSLVNFFIPIWGALIGRITTWRLQTPLGEQYVWGVAFVDVDLAMIRERCGAGEILDVVRNR